MLAAAIPASGMLPVAFPQGNQVPGKLFFKLQMSW